MREFKIVRVLEEVAVIEADSATEALKKVNKEGANWQTTVLKERVFDNNHVVAIRSKQILKDWCNESTGKHI